VLSDGTSVSCTGDCMQFKGIGARYLALLFDADPSHTEYRDVLTRSAVAIWTLARDPASGLFGVDWGAPLAPPPHLEATSSAGMTLSAAATLSGPPGPEVVTYEAEEGVLHHVGLEATHAGFQGWGYVAGFGAEGQGVDFLVDAPAAGTYEIDLRFAAASGDASRELLVNGASVEADLPFASTGSWSAYASTKTPATLLAGPNVVSVLFHGSAGSHGFLNLDSLAITKLH
jgi:hypothetical protein